MESKMLAFLFAAMAMVVVATLIPATSAARNEVAPLAINPNAMVNIRNPFANIIFLAGRNGDDCIPVGQPCNPFSGGFPSCCEKASCIPNPIFHALYYCGFVV